MVNAVVLKTALLWAQVAARSYGQAHSEIHAALSKTRYEFRSLGVGGVAVLTFILYFFNMATVSKKQRYAGTPPQLKRQMETKSQLETEKKICSVS